MSIVVLGYVAAALTTISFLPQVLKTWSTGAARDLSLTTLAMFFAGVTLWLVYGTIIGDGPLAVANAITATLVASLLFLKLRDMARARRAARDQGFSK